MSGRWGGDIVKSQRVVIASAIGLGVALVCLVALRELTPNFLDGLDRARAPDVRGPLIWFLVLGVAIGAAAIAARYHYLIAAVPAAVLFVVYLSVLVDLSVPSWYPDWLSDIALLGFGPTPYVIVGVLAVAAGTHATASRSVGAERSRETVGR
jgi:hypothetical protein